MSGQRRFVLTISDTGVISVWKIVETAWSTSTPLFMAEPKEGDVLLWILER